MLSSPPTSPLFPYTTLFRSNRDRSRRADASGSSGSSTTDPASTPLASTPAAASTSPWRVSTIRVEPRAATRSEEHTSELQSQSNLVCRLLLEKKKTTRSEQN